MAKDARRLITREALALGLDPRAVLAVAAGEGGFQNRSGDVGDLAGGGSYGPFQMYAQGALPSRYRGNAAAADSWAWSQEGVRYALRQMVKAGAGGLKGANAVETIIRKFERPADPDSSVQNAVTRLGQAVSQPPDIKGRAAQAFQTGPAAIVRGPSPTQMLGLQQQKVMSLLQLSSSTIAQDQAGGFQAIQQLNQVRQAMFQANQQVIQADTEARQTGGSIVPAGPVGAGRTFKGSSQMQKILQTADAQIGKPYVWGAETPDEGGFDCSGLIDWSFKQAGIDLPGRLTTYTAVKMGLSVKGKPMQPGDWIISNGGKHMTMYVGNGQVIAAAQRGTVIRYQPVSDFEGDIVDVRRVLK